MRYTQQTRLPRRAAMTHTMTQTAMTNGDDDGLVDGHADDDGR